jgi:hypothetical protein
MQQSPVKLIVTQLRSVTSSQTEAMKTQTKHIKKMFSNSITQYSLSSLWYNIYITHKMNQMPKKNVPSCILVCSSLSIRSMRYEYT